MTLSLTSGWTIGVAIGLFALASLLVSGSVRRLATWRRIGITAAIWVALATLADVFTAGELYSTRLPWSVYLWMVMPIATLLLPALAWRHTTRWRRLSTPLLLCLAVVASGVHLDRWFGYYPTLDSLLNPPPTSSLMSAQRIREASLMASPSSGTVSSGRVSSGRVSSIATPTVSGQLVSFDPPATVSGFPHRPGFAWLPPAWFQANHAPLPVVIFLSGSPGAPDDWLRAIKTTDLGDAWQKTHHGEAPILVFPDSNGSRLNDTECVDGPQGRAETYLTSDVVAAVTTQLSSSTNPAQWAVVGLSEGGTCALHLTLRHSDVFRTFVDLSGDAMPTLGTSTATLTHLYGGDVAAMAAHDPAALLANHRYPDVHGWFETGTGDTRGQQALAQLLPQAVASGMDVGTATRDGGHTFAFWRGATNDMFTWLMQKISR